jgi:hypothetical protein
MAQVQEQNGLGTPATHPLWPKPFFWSAWTCGPFFAHRHNAQVNDLSENIWHGVAESIYLSECHTNDWSNFIIAQN